MPAHSSVDSNCGHHEIAAANKDIAAFVINQTYNQTYDQELSALTHQSPFINPWPAEPQHEDVFALVVPWWKDLPIRTQLSTVQADLAFEVSSSKPTGTKGISPPRTINSLSSPTTPEKWDWNHPDSVSGGSQGSPNAREEKKVKMTQSNNVPESSRSIGNPMECFPASNVDSNCVSFVPKSENMENRTQRDYLSTPVGGCALVGGVLELAQQQNNLCGDSIDCGNQDLDWNISPIRFGESVTSMGVSTNDHYPTQLGDADLTKAATMGASVGHHDRDSGTGGDVEPECEFNLKAIKKTVEDVMKLLKEMQQEKENLASKNRQDAAKITIMRALLEWLPEIHLVAPGIEYNASLENAHRCLMYAAKIMKTLDEMERGYGLMDLEYGVDVSLIFGGNKIKEWKSVASYEPYGILVWIWRDLCLSILLDDEAASSSGREVVACLLSDIKGSVPLETYDFLRKEEIFSFWDLFLAGGSPVTARKRVNLNIRNPKYWPDSFIKARESLEHLYCVNRLNELRECPSVDLYRTIKSIVPEKYQKELLETIKTECKASKLEAIIDIFVFERTTGCLERLLQEKTLERNSKRFRDILVAFSSSKKAEAEWARKQVLIGFEEEVKAVSGELLRVFPNIHAASTRLYKEGDIGLDVERFLELVREGYADDRCGGDMSKVKYRHIFQAYLATGLEWNGGLRNSARAILLTDMKNIFLSNLGIIFELNGFVGKALKKGCTVYKAPELKAFLEYVLGDFGFEQVFKIEAVVTPKRTPSSANKRSSASKLFSTKRVSRGIAKVKAKGAKRPIEISSVKVNSDDDLSE